jgi:DNA polymerase-3 subunit beta
MDGTMKFEIQREVLLGPIQAVIGVVERRQTMPILANLLLTADERGLTICATDLEVELVAHTDVTVIDDGEVTVPGRKLWDICRALPAEAKLTISLDRERLLVRAGRSRFNLATLPAADFPLIEDIHVQTSFSLPQGAFRELLEGTHFSMAQQDVRYYLNGLLLEMSEQRVRAVATDGHRLALGDLNIPIEGVSEQQVIVPRKSVLELQRVLSEEDTMARVEIGTNHIRVQLPDLQLTSKLIDGRYPEYERVIPQGGDKTVKADRRLLREALGRAAILSNEKYRGVRLRFQPERLHVRAHNPEQEEAEDELEINYDGEQLEIGFNVNYVMDALAAIHNNEVELQLSDSNSSCLILDPADQNYRYVVMPMRL